MRIKIIQKILDKIRKKSTLYSKSEIEAGNYISIAKKNIENIKLNIVGKNNKINISEYDGDAKILVNVYGDNNQIKISEGFILGEQLYLQIGQNHKNFGKCNNTKFNIGENTSIESLKYVTYNCGAECNIGKDCMIAGNVTLFNTDAHPIFDKDTKQIINKVKSIFIGNHCWLGMNVTVLKNSTIPDGCVIGWGSVFSGNKENRTNCVFAGNPARVVRENIDWSPNGSSCGYIENGFIEKE